MKLFFFVVLCFIRPVNAKQDLRLPASNHHTVVIAHRGDHIHVPENTLAAYRNAIKDGADYVEVDLRTTKDGHLVILHDATVNRMTGNEGAVKELTFNEIKKMKVLPVNKNDIATYHIPDFKSVLALCSGHINIYLDFKDANVQKTYDLIKADNMQKHVVVYLNKKEQYDQWKKIAPQIPLIASLPEDMSLRQLDSLLKRKKISIVDNAYDSLEISFLHHKGIAVWLDVESATEKADIWQRMLDIGADGLQTDHPKKLIQYLKRKGSR